MAESEFDAVTTRRYASSLPSWTTMKMANLMFVLLAAHFKHWRLVLTSGAQAEELKVILNEQSGHNFSDTQMGGKTPPFKRFFSTP